MMIRGLLIYIAIITLFLIFNKKYWTWFYSNHPQEEKNKDYEQENFVKERKD